MSTIVNLPSAKIDAALADALAFDGISVDQPIPVIITAQSGALDTLASLVADGGGTVRHLIFGLSAVVAVVPQRMVHQLAARNDVELLEFDSRVVVA
jgi:hypothetical protein